MATLYLTENDYVLDLETTQMIGLLFDGNYPTMIYCSNEYDSYPLYYNGTVYALGSDITNQIVNIYGNIPPLVLECTVDTSQFVFPEQGILNYSYYILLIGAGWIFGGDEPYYQPPVMPPILGEEPPVIGFPEPAPAPGIDVGEYYPPQEEIITVPAGEPIPLPLPSPPIYQEPYPGFPVPSDLEDFPVLVDDVPDDYLPPDFTPLPPVETLPPVVETLPPDYYPTPPTSTTTTTTESSTSESSYDFDLDIDFDANIDIDILTELEDILSGIPELEPELPPVIAPEAPPELTPDMGIDIEAESDVEPAPECIPYYELYPGYPAPPGYGPADYYCYGDGETIPVPPVGYGEPAPTPEFAPAPTVTVVPEPTLTFDPAPAPEPPSPFSLPPAPTPAPPPPPAPAPYETEYAIGPQGGYSLDYYPSSGISVTSPTAPTAVGYGGSPTPTGYGASPTTGLGSIV